MFLHCFRTLQLEIFLQELKDHKSENYVQSSPARLHHERYLLRTGAEVIVTDLMALPRP